MDALGFDNVDPEENATFFRQRFSAEIDAATVIPAIEEGGEGFLLVDVRDPESFQKGHVEGAVNIPFQQLGKAMNALDPEQNILTYCYDHPCLLSARAARMLSSKGFKVKDVIGGFEDFEKKGAPIVTGEGPELAAATAN
ncbi:MAG: rhodanese-like domain-containing protein [Candidatus Thermoplasmatota archaeon]|nr:rhodanese-like domain-containing protein [Candidatus Thermoplasmatota archaeon]